jgi:hypothetical protein
MKLFIMDLILIAAAAFVILFVAHVLADLLVRAL